MIVSTMANDEIFKECMQDFWEMKSGIEHLGDRFRKAHNPKNKKKYGLEPDIPLISKSVRRRLYEAMCNQRGYPIDPDKFN